MTLDEVHIASLIICWCTFSSVIAKTEFITPNNGVANVTAKSNIIIRCPIHKKAKKLKNVMWERNTINIGTLKGNAVEFKGRFSRVPTEKVNKSEYDLLITEVTPADEGVYQCRQVDTKGAIYFGSTVRLHVPQASKPPKLYQIKSDLRRSVNKTSMIFATVGKKLVLRCEAKGGHPGASIRWRIRGNFVDPNSEGTFSFSSISGSVKTHQKLVSVNRPPRYRDTYSVLTAYLDKSHNKSMVTCFAFNAGTKNQRIIAKILVMPSGANSLSNLNNLVIVSLAAMVYLSYN